MDFNSLISSLESNKINPYQIYNLDMDYPQYFSVDHYLKNPSDSINKNQKIQKLFIDIEVYSENTFSFDELEKGKHPISAITIFSDYEKIFHSYFLLIKKNIDNWKDNDPRDYLKSKLIENGYIDEDFDVCVKTYTSDLQLIKEAWTKIHELDPIVISGYNSDNFDYPYIYYRLKNLYNNDVKSVSRILSKFGDISVQKFGNQHKVRFIEFVNADILYLFKPRADGGLNLGWKLSSYSLDFVSEEILKKKKLDYKEDGLNLDSFYEQDPLNYLLYNIIDVCLVYQLEQRLKLIDQYNMYRRLMKTSLDSSLRGPTILFDTLVYNNLSIDKKYIRFGLNDETIITIDKPEIDKIAKPLSNKKIKWTINEINKQTYLKITRKFEGAYVKNSPGKVVDENDGLIIDLDATSLYPSMIRQNNISFDTYYGRVLDPLTTSKSLNLIDAFLKNKKDPNIKRVYSNFLELIVKYIESDKITVQNMNDTIQQYYYVISYLFNKIIYSKCNNIKEIFNHQSDYYNYVVLKKYLIPFINLIDEIHDNSTEYNHFCYEYLLNNKMIDKTIYIIENINSPNIKIVQILSENLDGYLKKNNLILTLTGCLFYKQEYKLSLFSGFLEEMYNLRKQYKKERDTFDQKSDDYKFFDARQLATKIAMNTSYGLYGQATFRYSNNWLAKTITCQGRLALKISQEVAENYLKNYKE